MFVVVLPAGDAAAITTASPGAASPNAWQALVHQRDHLVRVGGLARGQRRHAPQDGARPADVLAGDERVDRAARPLRREETRRATGLRVARDGHDVAVLDRDGGGRVGHGRSLAGVPARRLRRPVLLAPRLHGRRDPRGGRGRLEREAADRRLARQHDAVRAVQHGVRDVGGLGARGPGRADHRLEHLRRDDRRRRGHPCRAQQVLLQERDLLHRQLHAQVAASDHHDVGHPQDLVDVLHRGLRLDLRHDRHRAIPHQRAELLDVLRTADERLRHQVDAQVERPREALPVALGDRRQAEPFGGDVHPLAGADRAAAHALGPHHRAVDARSPSARPRRPPAGCGRRPAGRAPDPDTSSPRPPWSPPRRGAARTPAPARASAGPGAACRAAPSDRGGRPSRRAPRRSSPRRLGPARPPGRDRRANRARS